MDFEVKVSIEIPKEGGKPEETEEYSFESLVMGTSKEKVAGPAGQETKTFFLVYDEESTEFAWVDSTFCELIDYVLLVDEEE